MKESKITATIQNKLLNLLAFFDGWLIIFLASFLCLSMAQIIVQFVSESEGLGKSLAVSLLLGIVSYGFFFMFFKISEKFFVLLFKTTEDNWVLIVNFFSISCLVSLLFYTYSFPIEYSGGDLYSFTPSLLAMFYASRIHLKKFN